MKYYIVELTLAICVGRFTTREIHQLRNTLEGIPTMRFISAVIACVFSTVALCPAFCHALDGHDCSRLHVLIVADTADEDIGDSVAVDRDRISKLLLDGVPTSRLGRSQTGTQSLTILDDKNVTAEKIREYYRQLDCQPSDAVFFYYAGHGETVQGRGHLLNVKGSLYRSELLRLIERKGARLNIVITDCCSSTSDTAPPSEPAPPDPDPSVLRWLFFRHQGLVDITAAKTGTGSLGNTEGGVFSQAFRTLLLQDKDDVDSNHDGRLEWSELFTQLAMQTDSNYQRAADKELLQDQSHQLPEQFSLASATTHKLKASENALGILTVAEGDTDARVCRITQVFSDSPADWAGLREGELVREVIWTGGPNEDRSYCPIMSGAVENDAADSALSATPHRRIKLSLFDPVHQASRGVSIRLAIPHHQIYPNGNVISVVDENGDAVSLSERAARPVIGTATIVTRPDGCQYRVFGGQWRFIGQVK